MAVETRPLDVTVPAKGAESNLSAAGRVLLQQWRDAVLSGVTTTHPFAVNRDATKFPAGVTLESDPYEDYTPPSTGDASQQITAAVTPLDGRLTVVEGALPAKVSEAQVDTKIAATKSKFRGDWASGELVWADNFAAGVGAFWVPANGAITRALTGGGSKPAGYTTELSGGGNSSWRLDISEVPQLVGKTLVQVKFWHSVYRFIGGANTLSENGVQKWSRSTGADSTSPWEQQTVALSGTGDLTWAANDSQFFLTGVEIYASVSPYMLGEFVLYKGKMWKSKSNNNGATPGSGGTWEEVPVNFNQTYTTAGRPSASAAGKGATIYDSDLNIPLYSNGTAWTNAAGTVV